MTFTKQVSFDKYAYKIWLETLVYIASHDSNSMLAQGDDKFCAAILLFLQIARFPYWIIWMLKYYIFIYIIYFFLKKNPFALTFSTLCI